MQSLIVSLRISVATLIVCVAGYTLMLLGLARALDPDTASGSLMVRPDGTLVGSHFIAQKFEHPGYFWSRPSAPDYDAMGGAGSNKSPTSRDLTQRANAIVARYGATASRPLPADLVAASGSGLDPHITAHAASYQAGRVAAARGLPRDEVDSLLEQYAFSPGGFLTPDRLVNVLELNLALDRQVLP